MRFNNTSRTSYLHLWLGALIALVLIMISIGGATRLTGSGLSITEWKPIAGLIPPLNAETWNAEFERYKQIPQYKLQNIGISLEEFKPLFWWEWCHRELGRFIGFVYILGFLGLVMSGVIRRRKLLAFTAIGVLLGSQAFAGWLMVHSGLQDGMVAVAPVRLAVHLTLAFLFLGSLVWMFANGVKTTSPSKESSLVSLQEREQGKAGARALIHEAQPDKILHFIIALILIQVILGALVAGNKAGLVYNTWPLMDGVLIPSNSALFFEQPWWLNFLDNHLMVQFVHRMSAYVLLAVVICNGWYVWRVAPCTKFSKNAVHLAGLIILQAIVGVMTLLLHVPLWAGLMHQSMAALIFAYAIWCVADQNYAT